MGAVGEHDANASISGQQEITFPQKIALAERLDSAITAYDACPTYDLVDERKRLHIASRAEPAARPSPVLTDPSRFS